MNILLFAATGMIGQGVLRECLLARPRGEDLYTRLTYHLTLAIARKLDSTSAFSKTGISAAPLAG